MIRHCGRAAMRLIACSLAFTSDGSLMLSCGQSFTFSPARAPAGGRPIRRRSCDTLRIEGKAQFSSIAVFVLPTTNLYNLRRPDAEKAADTRASSDASLVTVEEKKSRTRPAAHPQRDV